MHTYRTLRVPGIQYMYMTWMLITNNDYTLHAVLGDRGTKYRRSRLKLLPVGSSAAYQRLMLIVMTFHMLLVHMWVKVESGQHCMCIGVSKQFYYSVHETSNVKMFTCMYMYRCLWMHRTVRFKWLLQSDISSFLSYSGHNLQYNM